MAATSINAFPKKTFPNPVQVILRAGITAGLLDALAAIIIYGPVFGKSSISRIFQGIASAVFGKPAFQGGVMMVLLGILFHFIIAILFAAAYSLIYPRLGFFRKNKWVSAMVYGILVWMTMNLIVLPVAGMKVNLQGIPILRAALILILCVGFPITWITRYYFEPGQE